MINAIVPVRVSRELPARQGAPVTADSTALVVRSSAPWRDDGSRDIAAYRDLPGERFRVEEAYRRVAFAGRYFEHSYTLRGLFVDVTV
jgi:hypothetical protein